MSVYVNVHVHASVYRDQRASVNLEPKILAIVRDMECLLGPNSGPLEVQQVLLIDELSLQTLACSIDIHC